MNNRETELKIALTESEYDKLLSVHSVQPILQTNYYFYNANMPRDTMLRLRLKNGEYTFCYKKLLSCADGINVCDERERVVDEQTAETLISAGLTPANILELANVAVTGTYACVGKLDTYRAKFDMLGLTVELDKNEYLGAVDYELECECDDLEQLRQLKNCLSVNYGVIFKPSKSKSGRFFERYFRNK